MLARFLCMALVMTFAQDLQMISTFTNPDDQVPPLPLRWGLHGHFDTFLQFEIWNSNALGYRIKPGASLELT